MPSVTHTRPLHNVKYLMTEHLSEEEYHSLKQTYAFLCDLIDPKKYPNIPKKIRTNASQCLKHYPHSNLWSLIYDTVGFYNPR